MFNLFLDNLPDQFDGYLIRTDFKIALLIISLLNNADIPENKKLKTAVKFLYGKGGPRDKSVAREGLFWFLNNGTSSGKLNIQQDFLDFDFDSPLIYSSFLKNYNIDLRKTELHWWEFCYLLADIGDCALTKTINIRTKKITQNMSCEERSYYRNLKEKLAIPRRESAETSKNICEFLDLLKGGETKCKN